MTGLKRLWRQLVLLLTSDNFDRELEEEMRFHLEMKVDEHIARGMSPEEAWRSARHQFGDIATHKRASREEWKFKPMLLARRVWQGSFVLLRNHYDASSRFVAAKSLLVLRSTREGSAARRWRSIMAIGFFFAACGSRLLLEHFGLNLLLSPVITKGLALLLQVAICLFGIALVYRVGIRGALKELGLGASIRRALTFAYIATLPMLIVFALTSRPTSQPSHVNSLIVTIASPFAMEVLLSGYLFRQLYRRGRVRFWTAALIPSTVFAASHLYQADGLDEMFGVAAITGMGSLLFCWLFTRWRDNLWIPIGLHVLMNLWWEVFSVDETALGTWTANAARLMTVAVAILLTIYKDRFWKPLSVEPLVRGKSSNRRRLMARRRQLISST